MNYSVRSRCLRGKFSAARLMQSFCPRCCRRFGSLYYDRTLLENKIIRSIESGWEACSRRRSFRNMYARMQIAATHVNWLLWFSSAAGFNARLLFHIAECLPNEIRRTVFQVFFARCNILGFIRFRRICIDFGVHYSDSYDSISKNMFT